MFPSKARAVRKLRPLLWFVFLLILPFAAHAKGPQQMIFFKQKVMVGSKGGSIRTVCGNVHNEAPWSKDSYTHFSGKMWVTKIENGNRERPIPIDEAVNDRKWIEFVGRDLISPRQRAEALLVRPRVPQESVQFEIDVEEPSWAATSKQLLEEMAGNLDKAPGFVNEIEATRLAAAGLPFLNTVETAVQDIIWTYDWKSEKAQLAKTELGRIRSNLQRLSNESTAKQFLARTEETQKQIDRLSTPEGKKLGAELGKIKREYVTGDQSKQIACVTALDLLDANVRYADNASYFLSPTKVAPVFDVDGKLVFDMGVKPTALPNDPKFAGRPVLVDVSKLTVGQFDGVARRLEDIKNRDPRFDYFYKLSRNGDANFNWLPYWEGVRLLLNQTQLEALPPNVRDTIISQLQHLMAFGGSPSSATDVELHVDHFSEEGIRPLARIEARIRNGDFKEKHLILVVCNPIGFDTFINIAKRALEEGGARSVCVPFAGAFVQARISPLIIGVLKTTQASGYPPAKMWANACRDVRGRLERCKGASNLREALRREFSFLKDASELFETNNSISIDLIEQMIRQLAHHENLYLQVVENTAHGFGIGLDFEMNLAIQLCTPQIDRLTAEGSNG